MRKWVILVAVVMSIGTAQANTMAEEAGRYLGGNPIGWAHQWCGRFMAYIAEKLGYHPPRGSNAAIQWVHFGSPAAPGTPGSVMVMRHHVGIVLANLGHGRVLLRSGNHGHRVADGVYPIRRAVAWRYPS